MQLGKVLTENLLRLLFGIHSQRGVPIYNVIRQSPLGSMPRRPQNAQLQADGRAPSGSLFFFFLFNVYANVPNSRGGHTSKEKPGEAQPSAARAACSCGGVNSTPLQRRPQLQSALAYLLPKQQRLKNKVSSYATERKSRSASRRRETRTREPKPPQPRFIYLFFFSVIFAFFGSL